MLNTNLEIKELIVFLKQCSLIELSKSESCLNELFILLWDRRTQNKYKKLDKLNILT